MTKLVTLRTKPIEDPGEWCSMGNNSMDAPCPRLNGKQCDLGHFAYWMGGRRKRPQSCIDGQEECKP